ncbi:hypothetical protein PoB_000066400 [Plakobranchus ocellatus]|uniref:Uncharacterized protein n=1 Tax=Plakobranchus ocellatus TaxID=259542 RepID=A0AAV3XSU0_9GAST|nr:hypothetical protein PoB_000066400 [Plakobranchus ocellatus]
MARWFEICDMRTRGKENVQLQLRVQGYHRVFERREPLPGVVILTECRALMQALDGSGRVDMVLTLAEDADCGSVTIFPCQNHWQRNCRCNFQGGKASATAIQTINSI